MKYIFFVSVLVLQCSTLFAQQNGRLYGYWKNIEECEKVFRSQDTLKITQNQIDCILKDTLAFQDYSNYPIIQTENIVIVLLINAHYEWINNNNSQAIELLNKAEKDFQLIKGKRKNKLRKDFGVFESTFIEHKELFKKIKKYPPPPIPMASADMIAAMPKFEKPLTPTSRYDCSQFFSSCSNLSCVDEKLSKSVSSLGYTEKSYFYVNNGYVITLRLERTDEYCSYFCENRSSKIECSCRFKYDNIVFERHNSNSFTLREVTEYFDAFLFGRRAYFRLFVFVVTDDYIPTQKSITQTEAIGWIENGHSGLPIETARKKFTSNYSVNCWVYEYQANDNDKVLKFVRNSGNSAYIHLQKSGILGELEK